MTAKNLTDSDAHIYNIEVNVPLIDTGDKVYGITIKCFECFGAWSFNETVGATILFKDRVASSFAASMPDWRLRAMTSLACMYISKRSLLELTMLDSAKSIRR